jgi:hypothetical protein
MAQKVRLPVGHPSVDRYVCVNNSVPKMMDVCNSHPLIHDQLSIVVSGAASYSYPSSHLSVHSFFAPFMPSSHPDLDSLMKSGVKYNSSHPNVDNYVNRLSPYAVCYNFSSVKFPGEGVCPSYAPSWHPAIDSAINNGSTKYPANHIKTQPMFASWMPSAHRLHLCFCPLLPSSLSLLRDIDMLMATNVPLPVGHPSMEAYVCSNASIVSFLQSNCPVSVSSFHPAIDVSINDPTAAFPSTHPTMQTQLAPFMPSSHGWVNVVWGWCCALHSCGGIHPPPLVAFFSPCQGHRCVYGVEGTPAV